MDLARRKSSKTARPVARQGRLPSCLTYCFPKDELNPCGPALYESDSFRSVYGIRQLEFGKSFLIEYVGAAIGRPCREMHRIRIGLRRIQTMYRRTSNARPYTCYLTLPARFQSTEHPKRGSIRCLVSCFFLVTPFASTLVLHENTLPVLVDFVRVLL